MIFPNPSPAREGRYVVLNSGHTYHDPELRFSYMVFPRLGDWAIVKVGENPPPTPTPSVAETVLVSGFFDEDWANPPPPSPPEPRKARTGSDEGRVASTGPRG